MRERHRTILKLELLQIAPLGVALMLAFALLTLQIHVWLAWIIVRGGVCSSPPPALALLKIESGAGDRDRGARRARRRQP